jgi:hypothetical protein
MLESYGPPTPPALSRSRVALELAAELVGTQGWPYLRAHIELRERDFDQTGFGLFGSGSPDGIDEVAAGRSGLAMINPSAVLSMAYRGTGPYTAPLLVRIIFRVAVVRPDCSWRDGTHGADVVRRHT